MPRDAVSRTANFERNGGHKWVKKLGKALKDINCTHSTEYRGIENHSSEYF